MSILLRSFVVKNSTKIQESFGKIKGVGLFVIKKWFTHACMHAAIMKSLQYTVSPLGMVELVTSSSDTNFDYVY